MASSATPITPTTLKIVRAAMFAGLLGFGGFAYVQGAKNAANADAQQLEVFRYVGFGLCALAIVAIGVLRGVRARAESDEARSRLSLIGTAFAEGAGFFGAVFMFLGGDMLIYAIALGVFLVSWAALPADPQAV